MVLLLAFVFLNSQGQPILRAMPMGSMQECQQAAQAFYAKAKSDPDVALAAFSCQEIKPV